MKKILVQFDFPSEVNTAQYDNVWEDLKAAGYAQPKGLLYHFGAPKENGGWLVVDVWESEEAFKKFSQSLMPVISKNNFPVVEPLILPLHNIYIGQKERAYA